MSTVHEFAFDEARRAITQQAESLEHLRGRAAIVLSAAAIVMGLTARDGIAAIAGSVAFSMIGVLTVLILWPRVFTFENDINTLLIEADNFDDDELVTKLPDVQRDWALYLRKHKKKNAKTIDWLTKFFSASCVLLIVEVLVTLIRPL